MFLCGECCTQIVLEAVDCSTAYTGKCQGENLMKIVVDSAIPDRTYFTSSDVAPVVNNKTLIISDGTGSRRSSWGAPAVTSTVILNTATFTVVHVGFHHKHRGGQQWYYFLNGQRRTWAQLDARRKRQVLASAKKAPAWAKLPGKIA